MTTTTRTKTDPPAPSPTAYPVLRGQPVRSLPYPLHVRIHDWWAGRRDGRVETIADTNPTPTSLASPSTAWLTHDQHRELERRTDEQLAHQARTVQLQIRHDTIVADLATAENQLAEARERLDGLQPLSEEDANRRGATETHTAPAVVRQRRQREHHGAVVAPSQREVSEAQARVTALTADRHDLAARLATLAEVMATRQARITELHERRRALYRRAHVRALLRSQRRASRRARSQQPTPLPRRGN